jgi:hypothetical protein
MQIQHVNVKLLVNEPKETNLEALIPVFHSWIEGQVLEELLLDVADYRHVPAGPGVVLIGHQANYSVDDTDERWGVRYNRKGVVEGSNQDRLRQAVRAAATACHWLQEDPRLEGAFEFKGDEMEFLVNDRLLAPHTDTTRDALRPEFEEFCESLLGSREYWLSFPSDRRQRFGITVKTSGKLTIEELLANLHS